MINYQEKGTKGLRNKLKEQLQHLTYCKEKIHHLSLKLFGVSIVFISFLTGLSRPKWFILTS